MKWREIARAQIPVQIRGIRVTKPRRPHAFSLTPPFALPRSASKNQESINRTLRLKVLASVFDEHRISLESAALKLTHDRAEAYDLIQDAAERALRCAPLVGEDDLLRWLCAVMRNLAIDRFRQQRARSRALTGLYVLELSQRPPLEVAAPDSLPEWSDFSEEDVSRAAAQLEAPFRDVFELSRELPLTQVAAELGIRPATAGTRLFRARRKLRELLRSGYSSEASPEADRRESSPLAELQTANQPQAALPFSAVDFSQFA